MRNQDGSIRSFTPRTAAQVKHDTGLSVQKLVHHAVRVADSRWGGTDAKSLSHTYDIAYAVTERALKALEAKGLVQHGFDSGDFATDVVWSVKR